MPQSSTHEILESAAFIQLVRARWRVSIVLCLLLFLIYYGYILLVAYDKALLARRIGETTTLGIPIGAAVIVGAWILTACYVIWANRRYDAEVRRLRERL